MRKAMLVLAVFMSSCGGSSGGGNSALFEAALNVLNKNTGPGHTHSAIVRDSGNARSIGCSEAFTISSGELRQFVESETEFALCGRQDNEAQNPLCLYPGVDAYRTLETAASVGGAQDEITVQLPNGQVEVSLTYTSSQFEYEFQAENNASECTSETRPTATYSNADIDGDYAVTVISIDQNGVPQTLSTGSTSCSEAACSGAFSTSGMELDSSTEAWIGEISFGGAQLELYATLSPNKQVAAFVGCPFSGLAPQDLVESCVFIGGRRL